MIFNFFYFFGGPLHHFTRIWMCRK